MAIAIKKSNQITNGHRYPSPHPSNQKRKGDCLGRFGSAIEQPRNTSAQGSCGRTFSPLLRSLWFSLAGVDFTHNPQINTTIKMTYSTKTQAYPHTEKGTDMHTHTKKGKWERYTFNHEKNEINSMKLGHEIYIGNHAIFSSFS